jgi:hypothetical protein
MQEQAPEQGKQEKESDANSPDIIPRAGIFSYYRDDTKETGGMKVKWTFRVADGAEAAALDDRQNHAIRELLEWAARRQTPR